jgi:hypothetical protein
MHGQAHAYCHTKSIYISTMIWLQWDRVNIYQRTNKQIFCMHSDGNLHLITMIWLQSGCVNFRQRTSYWQITICVQMAMYNNMVICIHIKTCNPNHYMISNPHEGVCLCIPMRICNQSYGYIHSCTQTESSLSIHMTICSHVVTCLHMIMTLYDHVFTWSCLYDVFILSCPYMIMFLHDHVVIYSCLCIIMSLYDHVFTWPIVAT